jgi:hypothetical protein
VFGRIERRDPGGLSRIQSAEGHGRMFCVGGKVSAWPLVL